MRWFGGDYDRLWHTLTLRRLFAARSHIRRHPPAEYFLAGFFQYEAPSENDAVEQDMPEPLPVQEP